MQQIVSHALHTIGARLRLLRGDMTQAEFGKKVGAVHSLVGAWERDERLVGARYLEPIAALTGCNLHWLLTGAGKPLLNAQASGTLGSLLRQRRKELGRSQLELADALGVHQSYISLIESDRCAPSMQRISRIAELFGDAPTTYVNAYIKSRGMPEPEQESRLELLEAGFLEERRLSIPILTKEAAQLWKDLAKLNWVKSHSKTFRTTSSKDPDAFYYSIDFSAPPIAKLSAASYLALIEPNRRVEDKQLVFVRLGSSIGLRAYYKQAGGHAIFLSLVPGSKPIIKPLEALTFYAVSSIMAINPRWL